jgi:hypothetical protein
MTLILYGSHNDEIMYSWRKVPSQNVIPQLGLKEISKISI